jgi:hypothetical protein
LELGRERRAGALDLDVGAAVRVAGVQVVERGDEPVGVDVGVDVDVKAVQDVGAREARVEERLPERVRDGSLGGAAELAPDERQRAGEVLRVSRRRRCRRPRRPGGSRSGPPRS